MTTSGVASIMVIEPVMDEYLHIMRKPRYMYIVCLIVGDNAFNRQIYTIRSNQLRHYWFIYMMQHPTAEMVHVSQSQYQNSSQARCISHQNVILHGLLYDSNVHDPEGLLCFSAVIHKCAYGIVFPKQ